MGIRVIGTLIALLSQLYLARLLGLVGYGRFAIALGWALLLVIVARRGLDEMAVRVATRYWEEGREQELAGLVRYSLTVMTRASLAILGLIVAVKLLLPGLSAKFSWPMAAGVAASVLPLAVLGFYSSLFLVSGRVVAAQSFEQIARPLVLIATLFTAHLLWRGPGSAEVAMFLTASSVAAVTLVAMLAWHRGSPAGASNRGSADRAEWHSISSSFVILALCQEGLNQAGILLLGILGTNVEAAHFAAAWRYNSFLAFGLAAVGFVTGPRIASAHRRSDPKELTVIIRTSARFSLAFAAAGAVFLSAFGRQMLGWFGPGFDGAYPVLLVLLIGSLANASTGVVSYLLSLTGSHVLVAKIMAAALMICVALNILLIPRYGPIGAATAAAVTQVLWNIALLIWARRRTGVLSWPL